MKASELSAKWKAQGLSDDEIKKKLVAMRKKRQAAGTAAPKKRKPKPAPIIEDIEDIEEAPVKTRSKRPPIQAPVEKQKGSAAGIIAMVLALLAIGGVGFAVNNASSGIDDLRGSISTLGTKLDEAAKTNKDLIEAQAKVITSQDGRIKQLEGTIDKAMESRVSREDIPSIVTEYRRSIIDKAKQSVIYIAAGPSQGSGFFVRVNNQFYGLTNCHVVGDLREVHIMTWDEKWATCTVVARDAATDLAILKVMNIELSNIKNEKNKLPPAAEIADSDKILIGDSVFAIGAPHGLVKTANSGQVSNNRRYLGGLPILDKVSGLYNTYLQIDAGVMPGNSGGPSFNDQGEVIGINTRANHTNETEGFVMPINFCMERVKSMLAASDKKNTYNSLGFNIDPFFRRRHEGPNIKVLPSDQDTGLIATRVFEDSPAYEAGFRTSDVILRINGKRVQLNTDADIIQIRREIAFGEPGTEFKFKVRSYPEVDDSGAITKESENKEITLKIVDEETYRLPVPVPMLRVYVNSISDDEIPEDRPGGVKIVTPFNFHDLNRILRGRRSVILPLKKDDIIVEIDGENIRNPGDLAKVLKDLEDVRQIPGQVVISRAGAEVPIDIKR